MNKKVKKMWIKALKTGTIDGKPVAQGHSRLRSNKKVLISGVKTPQMCCLGVLCEIAVSEGVVVRSKSSAGAFAYGKGGHIGSLPPEVIEWAGLDGEDPDVTVKPVSGSKEKEVLSLITLNDTHKASFKKIAKAIKKNL